LPGLSELFRKYKKEEKGERPKTEVKEMPGKTF
jgi:hypothetical protein